MDDDDYRDEYIMNDQGRVYKGMSIAIKHTPWNYAQVLKQHHKYVTTKYITWARQRSTNIINYLRYVCLQFEENILDCSLYLLDKCALDYGVRDDPVKIARCLSAIVSIRSNSILGSDV